MGIKTGKLFRNQVFWNALILLAVASLVFVSMQVRPIVAKITPPISINRSMALNQASEFAESLNLGPNQYQQTVIFRSNKRELNYVDWQTNARGHSLVGTPYEPFFWEVRHLNTESKQDVRF